jgi:hypothetical protein
VSDYSKSYDGAAKDAAQSTITGADFDTEFTSIETAVATKANKITSATTDAIVKQTATGDIADSGKVLPSGAVVGTTDTQTLTSKTLTSPDINGGTWNGTIDGGWSASGQTCSNLGSVTTADINGGTLGGVTVDGNLIANGKTLTPTELGYLDGATSNIQNQLDNFPSKRGALVYPSSTQSLSNGVEAAISFNTESYDTDSIHSNTTNNSRLTVPSGITKVKLSGNFQIASASDYTSGTLRIKKNGSTFIGGPYVGAEPSSSTGVVLGVSSAVVEVTSGDYFELYASQVNSATASRSTNLIANGNWFAMEIIE